MSKLKVLVSKDKYDYDGIIYYNTLKDIQWDEIDYFIFNSSIDSDIDTIMNLSKIKNKDIKVIYINKDLPPLLYAIFMGMEADIYDNEDYLKDKDVLWFLINNYKNTGMTIKPPDKDMETVLKSIASLSTSNIENIQKLLTNPYWLKTLNKAVTNVDNALVVSKQVNTNVVDFLHEVSNVLEVFEQNQEYTKREIDKLTKMVEDMERKTKPNSPFIFSTYTLPVVLSKVLYIKGFSPCRYLNSFMLSYQHYLRMDKQINAKILFVYPKLKLIMQKYKDIPRLSSESIDIINIGSNDVYITFEPKKVVLDAFFNQKADLFIVIDMLYGDDLLEGHQVVKTYAVSGISDIKANNLLNKPVFISLIGPKNAFTIPHINGYSNPDVNETTKKKLYYDKCKSIYERLDEILLK